MSQQSDMLFMKELNAVPAAGQHGFSPNIPQHSGPNPFQEQQGGAPPQQSAIIQFAAAPPPGAPQQSGPQTGAKVDKVPLERMPKTAEEYVKQLGPNNAQFFDKDGGDGVAFVNPKNTSKVPESATMCTGCGHTNARDSINLPEDVKQRKASMMIGMPGNTLAGLVKDQDLEAMAPLIRSLGNGVNAVFVVKEKDFEDMVPIVRCMGNGPTVGYFVPAGFKAPRRKRRVIEDMETAMDVSLQRPKPATRSQVLTQAEAARNIAETSVKCGICDATTHMAQDCLIVDPDTGFLSSAGCILCNQKGHDVNGCPRYIMTKSFDKMARMCLHLGWFVILRAGRPPVFVKDMDWAELLTKHVQDNIEKGGPLRLPMSPLYSMVSARFKPDGLVPIWNWSEMKWFDEASVSDPRTSSWDAFLMNQEALKEDFNGKPSALALKFRRGEATV